MGAGLATRRALAGLVLAWALTFAPVEAQEEKKEEHSAGHEERNLDTWKWLNFALLVGGLGYLLSKSLPGFFKSRTGEIQKGIKEAAEIRKEAEARAAEMDRKMANLRAEIEALRAGSKQEMAAEGERIRKETVEQLAKIQAQAESAIAGATKAARHELKALSAALALQLAEKKVQERMTPPAQSTLVDNFIADIERTVSK